MSGREVMVSTPSAAGQGGDAPAGRESEPCDEPQQPVDIKGWRVFVVDAHSLIFQVFHALPEMSSPRGEQVGAVFGFVRDMLYLIEEKKPDALICAFDLSGPTFRNEMFDGYKADRGEMPDELVGQIPKIERVLGAMAIPVLACQGFEADDVLATVARICDEAGANCFLVTGDKDCRQLITDRVAVYNIRKNQVFDAAALRQEWGVGPDQVVDFQALIGDKVDCVPGVPGIGPKTAQTLLETYGTLDNLLEHAGEVPGAKGKSAGREPRDRTAVARTRAARRVRAHLAQLGRQPSRRHGSRRVGRAVCRVWLPQFSGARGTHRAASGTRRDDRASRELPAHRHAGQAG